MARGTARQIPLREVDSGALNRFGSIDPTEGGHTDRENLNLQYQYYGSGGDLWSFQLYGSRYKLSLWSDFTFYRDTGLRFIRLADGRIIDTRDGPVVPNADYLPGDEIEQNDERLLYGGRGSYTHPWFVAGLPIESQIGLETRNDNANVALYRTIQRARFFAINKLSVEERSFSGYMEQRILLASWLRLEVGLRGDLFYFHGNNRLPEQPNDPNFDPAPIAGSTTAGIVSPKVNLIASIAPQTDLFANFGTGFHSNDARNVLTSKDDPHFSPLARATAFEFGARTTTLDGRVEAAADFWYLNLASELVFSGDAGAQETAAGGTLQPNPGTHRYGVDLETRLRFTDSIFGEYDLAWANARYNAGGGYVALAPTLLMNGGITAEPAENFWVGLHVRFLGDRAANDAFTLTASGYTLLDLSGKYRWRNLQVSLSLLNVLDRDWREAQFSDETCVRQEVGTAVGCSAQPGKQDAHPTDPTSDIHFTPGDPIAVRGGLTFYF